MGTHHRHRLSRRDFLKLTGVGLGGATLAACSPQPPVIEVTAIPAPATVTPPPTATIPAPTPTLTASKAADAVLVNGNIVTMDAGRSTAQALAIKDGLILLVGDEQAARGVVGGGTQIIDLAGRTVTPGLVDAHCHLSICGMVGTVFVDVNWPGVSTIEQMQARVAERIAATPAAEWVVGVGWMTYDGRYPDKHDLDPVSPNHPVMLINQGGHMAAVNSYALKLAGVTAGTQDPGNGRFLREANNEPNGTVMNHPAMDYFRRLWPPDLQDLEAMEASVLGPQAKFASMGVTSFQDVYVRDLDGLQAYFNIARDGGMTIRGQVMNVLEYYRELAGRLDTIDGMRYEDDFMRFAGVKCQVDGGAESSFTHEPHNGVAWNISIWKPSELNEVVRTFHDAGYQVSLHALGDAAVDMALDSIEAAMNANPRPDPRHRIEHCLLPSPSAMDRIKDLGVVISTQPQMIRAFGEALERIWGKERVQRMIPTRTWLDMSVPLCLSSDAPSMPWWDPQMTLFASVVRSLSSKRLVSPDQALTIDEAMYAHTMVGAYADFAEKKKGSLEPGKFADLIVWHDNPYSVEAADILNLTIDMTVVGGKTVYQA